MSTPTAPILDIKNDPLKIQKHLQIAKNFFHWDIIFLVGFGLMSTLFYLVNLLMGASLTVLTILQIILFTNIYYKKKAYLKNAADGISLRLYKDHIEYWLPNFWGSYSKKEIFTKDIMKITHIEGWQYLEFTLINNKRTILLCKRLLAKNSDILDGIKKTYPKLIDIQEFDNNKLEIIKPL